MHHRATIVICMIMICPRVFAENYVPSERSIFVGRDLPGIIITIDHSKDDLDLKKRVSIPRNAYVEIYLYFSRKTEKPEFDMADVSNLCGRDPYLFQGVTIFNCTEDLLLTRTLSLFKGQKSLRAVSLGRCDFGESGLTSLVSIPSLEELVFTRCGSRPDRALSKLIPKTGLKSIRFVNTNAVNALNVISISKTVESIEIESAALGDEDFSRIAENHSVIRIKLNNIDIYSERKFTGKTFGDIRRFLKLQELTGSLGEEMSRKVLGGKYLPKTK